MSWLIRSPGLRHPRSEQRRHLAGLAGGRGTGAHRRRAWRGHDDQPCGTGQDPPPDQCRKRTQRRDRHARCPGGPGGSGNRRRDRRSRPSRGRCRAGSRPSGGRGCGRRRWPAGEGNPPCPGTQVQMPECGSVLVAVRLPAGQPFAVALTMMLVFTVIGLVLGVLIPRQPVQAAEPADSGHAAAT